MRGLLKEPPLYTTGQTPESILGEHQELYERHYRAWKRNEHDPDKVYKVFNEKEIDIVGRLNADLLNHGFRPMRLNGSDIAWGIITSSHIRIADNYKSRIPSKQEVVGQIDKLKRGLRA